MKIMTSWPMKCAGCGEVVPMKLVGVYGRNLDGEDAQVWFCTKCGFKVKNDDGTVKEEEDDGEFFD